MAVIFNELKYAENLLEKGFQDYIKYSDLLVLSKYFRYKGLNNSNIKESIVDFYRKFNPNYNSTISGDKIDTAIHKSKKYELRIPTEIKITKKEVEKIRSIKNYKYEKICFMMLVISRSNKIAYSSKSLRYYINQNFSEILEMAGVRADKKSRNKIKYDLFLLGMIKAPEPNRMSEFSKYQMFELLYYYEDSPCEIIVTDFDNILSFYPQKCIECDKIMESQKKRLKEICNECYEEKRGEDKRKRAKEIYYKNN